MLRFSLICLFVSAAAGAGRAAGEVLSPVSARFSQELKETPDFQRHVLPLLGRLGCNGRACHGSFQGRGGFQLSLFGYDFAADHAALTAGDDPRIDRDHPPNSLILQKPTRAVEHEGGRLIQPGGWEHRLLQRWIESGAAGRPADGATLQSLTIQPSEIVFDAAEQRQPLRVIAGWSDGVVEDVTPLCRFRVNDGSVAAVSEEGVVSAAGPGDSHAIAFYDNGVAAIPVITPRPGPLSQTPEEEVTQQPAPTEIDRMVAAKLRKIGVAPSPLCRDEEFLRRVSLDLTGTPPAPAEVVAFLADPAPDKRTAKVDELLNRPSYAAWMTTRLCDWTGNTEENLPVGGEQNMRRQKSSLWYDWVYRRVARNTPYDELVEGMVLAVSRRPGQTDDEYFAEMTSYFREQDPADYAVRPSMPFFWSRGRFSPPQAERFTYAFLGVRLVCAECHKHPYDQWTQADYQDFQTFFEGVRYRYSSTRGEVKALKQRLGLTADQDSGVYKRLFAHLAHEGTIVPWGEVVAADFNTSLRRHRRRDSPGGRIVTPRLLGGGAVNTDVLDPREPLMNWLREQRNPYFARALVNRIWAGCFGVGLVEPPDDMNLANPPSNEPLLDYLAQRFIDSGYDLKELFRTITSSRTYQLSWRPNKTNRDDRRNYSRAYLRRLPAEVLYDAVWQATAPAALQPGWQSDEAVVRGRQIGFPDNRRRTDTRYALRLLGRPDRMRTCDCARTTDPSLLQTMYLRNDPHQLAVIDRPEGWLAELRGRKLERLRGEADALVRQAWLRTLCRLPSQREMQVGRRSLAAAEHPVDGLRDLLWALLNSKEFLLNH